VKIPVESYTTEANVRVLTKPCPYGVECKVGSMVCSRCQKFQKKQDGLVYCKAGRGKKESEKG
jgi:hypothetical protein